MVKAAVIQALAEELGVSIEVGERVMQGISDVFSKRLSQGKPVKLQGFGTFGVRAVESKEDAPEKKGKSPFVLPGNPGPYFKPSRELKRLAKTSHPAATNIWKRSKRAGRQPALPQTAALELQNHSTPRELSQRRGGTSNWAQGLFRPGGSIGKKE